MNSDKDCLQLDWGWSGGSFQEQLYRQGLRFTMNAPVRLYEQCREMLSEMRDYGWISNEEKAVITQKIMEHIADHTVELHVEDFNRQHKKRLEGEGHERSV